MVLFIDQFYDFYQLLTDGCLRSLHQSTSAISRLKNFTTFFFQRKILTRLFINPEHRGRVHDV